MVLQEIIRELKMLPDVFGGFFFHRKQGILYKDVPSEVMDSELNDMGRQLFKIYAARRLSFPEVLNINLYFGESAVLSRALDEQLLLLFFCNRQVNSSSLSVSMRLVIEEHHDALMAAASGSASDSPAVKEQLLSPQEVLDGPLKESLVEVQRILVDLMGPMAEFVYEENLEKWVASGRVGANLLTELIEMIAADLPEVKKAEIFKDRCRKLL